MICHPQHIGHERKVLSISLSQEWPHSFSYLLYQKIRTQAKEKKRLYTG